MDSLERDYTQLTLYTNGEIDRLTGEDISESGLEKLPIPTEDSLKYVKEKLGEPEVSAIIGLNVEMDKGEVHRKCKLFTKQKLLIVI